LRDHARRVGCGWRGRTIDVVANNTSSRSSGASGASPAKRSPKPADLPAAKRADRPPAGRKQTKAIVDARAEAQRIRVEAEKDAARIRAEAEEHARGLVLDARASADGVRAEGMELVSNLRELSDVLRSNAELLLRDIQAIHSRMVGELQEVSTERSDATSGAAAEADDHQLAIPDFVSRS
jgi:cell division septum initiation protein DivIVA